MNNISTILNHLRENLTTDDLELAFLLAFIDARSAQKQFARMTDLIQKLQFGTSPTVYRKVAKLETNGWISLRVSATDARAREMDITKQGQAWLRKLEKNTIGAANK